MGFYFLFQVTLDETTVQKVLSEDGFITKADFIKLGQDLKLLEFGGAMGEKRKALKKPLKKLLSKNQRNLRRGKMV